MKRYCWTRGPCSEEPVAPSSEWRYAASQVRDLDGAPVLITRWEYVGTPGPYRTIIHWDDAKPLGGFDDPGDRRARALALLGKV